MPAALSVDLRRRVVAALEQGLSCSQVAERFGVSRQRQPARPTEHARFGGGGADGRGPSLCLTRGARSRSARPRRADA